MSVVVVNWNDLQSPDVDLGPKILEAFGLDGLGVIAIEGIPEWESMVKTTIPLAHKFVHLPKETLESLEHAPSMYNAGWSYGKEKLGDKPDTKKGSFYFNPLSDNPRPEVREQYPWALPENLWPSKEMPELEVQFKSIGTKMHEVTVALATHIDKFGFGQKIAHELNTALKAKGRMLYYYPLTQDDITELKDKPDGWIGWHNDSGFLTALTPDLYFNHETGEVVKNPEPEVAGLWIADRSGTLRRIIIPPNCMAIQCGECLQVITGGRLVATPHCVRPPANTPGISRACCPLFVDCSPEFLLTSPNGREAALLHTVKQWVPPLADRWTDGQTFAQFLGDTFQAYYSWTKKSQSA